jgi:hypothetical protein
MKLRSRIRLHYGSQTECLYQLKTFGIPQNFLPLDLNTKQFSLKRHLDWVESRFAKEKHRSVLPAILPKEQSVTNPGENDVLVGTGKHYNTLGNQLLRSKVKELSQAYHKGTKEVRIELVNFVIKSVQESGGRFLKAYDCQDEFGVKWKELPKKQIRTIVTQAFRNSYRRR